MDRKRATRSGLVELLAVLLAIVLNANLASALAAPASGATTNQRLANSASPYLQLHKDDLVQWYPWGEAAFAMARKLNRPILVSFGYTACHWCHVMQEKHFNNPDMARVMNDNFVPVLVDRERRTALDEAYLLVTEVLTQRGGWPNNVFVTPDLKPFYGTTYVPPDRFAEILDVISTDWTEDRDSLVAAGDRLAALLSAYMTRKVEARQLTPQALAGAAQDLASQFDKVSGGIGESLKFFQQPVLMFPLQHGERNADSESLEAVERTLQAVSSGGNHDHLEGGFHRYAVDPGWRVPHFEKMLYDQSLTAEAFTTVYQITGRPEYARVARKTLDYVLSDLTAGKGGFYSTRDADSEGEEGTYYVWTPAQLAAALADGDAAYAARTFGTIGDGEFAGKIILNTDQVDQTTAPRVERIFQDLKKARGLRPKPRRDEKIVTSWNGLTIASLASGALVLDEPRYREAAIKAGEFIWNNMRGSGGQLMRSYFNNTPEVAGELEDYAQLARGFIFLFDLTAEQQWLDRAIALAGDMAERFGDPDAGDFYSTSKAEGFGRTKPRSDIDQPSGNAAALDVLTRLARRSTDPQHRRDAEATLAALSGIALKSPAGGAAILSAADRLSLGETGLVQYAGNGTVRVTALPATDKEHLVMRLSVADGWHVNADKPLEDYLIPTRLELRPGGRPLAAQISYPEPRIKKLAFSDKPLALLEGSFEITARIGNSDAAIADAILEVQVCSDELCLQPETLNIRFAWPDAAPTVQ